MPRVIRAYETLDCARRVRVHYYLPVEIDAPLLERLECGPVEVQAFSRYVAGAKDHFTLKEGDRLYAAGVLGEARIVATFGKVGGERPVARIEAFEARLAEMLDASIVSGSREG